jgi:hypothetical protein
MSKDKKEVEQWTTDIKDWQSLDPEAASLLLSLAQQHLTATIDSANIISSTRDKYMTVTTAVVTAAISYAVAGTNDSLTLASCMTIALCLIAYIFLNLNLNQYQIYPLGREPKTVFTEKMVGQYRGQNQYLGIVFAVMERIQQKIDHNKRINATRLKNNSRARIAILCVPFATVVAHAVVTTFY